VRGTRDFRIGHGRAGAWVCLGVVGLLIVGIIGYFVLRPAKSDPRLKAFVHARPPVPIVFTSRSEAQSVVAAAPEGEGYNFPGQRLWAAHEGRLRLLDSNGEVHELTWGQPLPDGSTLIDVMSPSVSSDGRRIIFAGRKGSPDHGRFRIYEIGIDGRGLRQLTGGPNDTGCVALPPMRFRDDGKTQLPDDERKRTDYDDVDPIYLHFGNQIAFVSSRTPDLGRGHARRSTNLWMMNIDGSDCRPATANRFNDRWPFLLTSKLVAFSVWSRNPEVVTADERDVRPSEPGVSAATRPADAWFAAFIQPAGSHFGGLIKPHVPAWRVRPLFNGRLVFMTSFQDPSANGPLGVVQVEPGMIDNAPSSCPSDRPLPTPGDAKLFRGPARNRNGEAIEFATPSPCPDAHVVLAGAPAKRGYGIYLCSDQWNSESPADPEAIELSLIFDDPDLHDCEPVAVYPRDIAIHELIRGQEVQGAVPTLTLADGRKYTGPAGQVFASALYTNQHADLPGQRTDAGQGPIFAPPPEGAIDHFRIYASRRDRFDDPHVLRIPGEWELLVKMPVHGELAGGWVPADVPTVLAGFTRDGKVARWTTPAQDASGNRATFYALAGDHYSLTRPGGKHSCTGCHAGHSGLAGYDHKHHERRR